VDVVLTFEGEAASGLRILCGGKNRFGPEGEVAWFEMGPGGLVEAEPGSRIGQGEAEPGCATALALAGRRAIAVDVQALVVSADGPPRRQVAGLDPRRFHIIAAVTGRVVGSGLSRAEIFGASSGGLRLEDPGTDLAIAVAMASAGAGRPLPPGTGFVGELALTGSVRPVSGTELRLSAALSARLRTVVVPASGPLPEHPPSGLELVPVQHLRDAVRWGLKQ
jgi:DNA repair protein RadA/Sms